MSTREIAWLIVGICLGWSSCGYLIKAGIKVAVAAGKLEVKWYE